MAPFHINKMAKPVWDHLKKDFAMGLFLMVPIVVTYIIIRLVFVTIDGLLRPTIEDVLGWATPGVGIVALLIIIFLVGMVGRNLVGQRIVKAGQQALLRIPVVRAVYSPAKQLIESFAGTGVSGFKRVVIIEYPRVGAWTIALVTNVVKNEAGEAWAVVYIPTAPTPQSGWVTLIPNSQVYNTDMTVAEAMKFILSGGIIAPGTIKRSKLGDVSALIQENTRITREK